MKQSTSNLKTIGIVLILLICHVVMYGQSTAPFQLADGECYAKHFTPDQYNTVTKKVLIKAASSYDEAIPAEYETITEEILVKPEIRKLIPVPAVYETVEEKIMTAPEKKGLVKVPAEYDTVEEKVLVAEAYTVKKVIPAEFEIVSEKIEIKPERKKIMLSPAEYENVEEKILVKEASEKLIAVPAEYETVSENYEVQAASTKTTRLEPIMKTVTEQVEVQPATTKWIEKRGTGTCLSADPKDCVVWCLQEIPAVYSTVSKVVNMGCDGSGVANSGCTKEENLPPQMNTINKRVIKSAATTRTEQIPAEYGTVVKAVLKTPASSKEEIIPAEYKTIEKKVVKTPARIVEETVPAVYNTLTKTVIKTPATTKEVILSPAEYKTVSKRVLKTPATTKEEIIPAEYEKISKRVIKTPANNKRVDVPAEYKDVNERVLESKGEILWKRIICEKDIKDQLVLNIQKALKAKGFNPGPLDDVYGKKTKAALVQFQKVNNLLPGHLDYETVAALGVDFKPSVAPANKDEKSPWIFASNPSNKATASTDKKADKKPDASKPAAKDKDKKEDLAKKAEDKKDDLASKGGADKPADIGKSSMTSEEQNMVKEINLMRANPKAYIPYIKAYIDNMKKEGGWGASYIAQEEAAANELIAELNKLGPLSQLKAKEDLYQVAVQHGNDLKGMGNVTHTGSNGSSPFDRIDKGTDLSGGNENLVGGLNTVRESVITLLIDNGIPNRGHRKTLLNPAWNYASCRKVGDVGGMPNSWVQLFGKK